MLQSDKFYPLSQCTTHIDKILESGELETTNRFHSYFFYEMRPLHTVATYLTAEAVKFTGMGNGHDGEIKINKENIIEIECTRDIGEAGHNESHQILHLKTQKRAPAYTKIKARGMKNNLEFGDNPVTTRLVDWKEITERKAQNFRDAFDKKTKRIKSLTPH